MYVGFFFCSCSVFIHKKPFSATRTAKKTDERYEIIVMFTKSSPQLPLQFPPPADHLNGTERQPLLISIPNGVLCRCCLPPGIIAGCYGVGMWCDVICIQGKAPVWSTQNGMQVFHIGIDSFRAGGERTGKSPLKWVYWRLFADQKNLVQDANWWDLSVQIKSARQLCYQGSFMDIKFKQTYSPKHFYQQVNFSFN